MAAAIGQSELSIPDDDRTGSDDSNKVIELEPDQYYYDGPYLVFTEAYHIRRGTCCESGCRHCPFGFDPKPSAAK